MPYELKKNKKRNKNQRQTNQPKMVSMNGGIRYQIYQYTHIYIYTI